MESTLNGEAVRLRTVTASAAAILDARTPEALRTILEITCERVVPLDAFAFAIYDAATDRIRLIGDPEAEPIALRGSPWENSLRRRRSVPADDGSGDLIVPVLDGTRSLAAMRVTPRAGRTFAQRDGAILDAIAALAGSALLVLGRLAAARTAEVNARRPDALRDLIRTVTTSTNEALCFEEAVGVCLAAVCELAGFPVAHAWVVAPCGEFVSTGMWQVRDVPTWGALCARFAGRRFAHNTGLPGVVAARGTALRIADTAQDPAFNDLARAGARGVWALPVRVGREVAAVLAFFTPQPIERDRALDVAATDIVGPLAHVIMRDRQLSEARLRARLLDAAAQAIIGCDAEHRIIVWNHAAELLFGWGREEAIGRIDSEIIRVRADSDQTAEITQRLASGQPWEGEFVVTRKDGATVPVLISGAAAYNSEGAPAGFVGVAVDLRRHLTAERQRRQTFAMDAVGRLAGAVAHDFNNLLTGIRGVAQLALDDLVPDSPLRSELDEIVHSADRAAALTARLLAFGRRQVLRPQVIDPAALVRSLEIDLRRAAGTDNELVLELSAGAGFVNVDPAQLERVLFDLVAHARAVMRRSGDIRIAISGLKLDTAGARALVDLHAGDWVVIDVTDSGAPLGAEALEQLFEPAPVGKTGVDPGLGLGTAYGVIRQSDGVITAESRTDRGTTLRIWLPRVDGAPEPTREAAPTPVTATGSETLLLVEDEATVRQLARKVLTRNGYKVLEAGDGVEALQVFHQHADEIALVITDIIMPSMGGPELVRRLRALRPDLRVLLMSGYTDDATLRRGFSRSDEAFLEKPFAPAALAQKVRKMLDAGSA